MVHLARLYEWGCQQNNTTYIPCPNCALPPRMRSDVRRVSTTTPYTYYYSSTEGVVLTDPIPRMTSGEGSCKLIHGTTSREQSLLRVEGHSLLFVRCLSTCTRGTNLAARSAVGFWPVHNCQTTESAHVFCLGQFEIAKLVTTKLDGTVPYWTLRQP